MNDDVVFFIGVLILIVPSFVSAIWMTYKQNKFFRLLELSNDKEYKKYKEESRTVNPIKQFESINRLDATLKRKYSDKTLDRLAKEARRAYAVTVAILIASGIITVTLLILNG